jgi:hypothetical protein
VPDLYAVLGKVNVYRASGSKPFCRMAVPAKLQNLSGGSPNPKIEFQAAFILIRREESPVD